MIDLGVAATDKKVFLYHNVWNKTDDPFSVGVSTNGLSFKTHSKKPVIQLSDGKKEHTAFCSDFRISSIGNIFYLLYKVTEEHTTRLKLAVSKDLLTWNEEKVSLPFSETSVLVPSSLIDKKYIVYSGEKNIKIGYSNDLKSLTLQDEPVLSPREDYFDDTTLSIGNVYITPKGILLLYYAHNEEKTGELTIGAALFDKNQPEKLLWRSQKPVSFHTEQLKGKSLYPLGVVFFENTYFFYWVVDNKTIFAFADTRLQEKIGITTPPPTYGVTKAAHNPIITPVMNHSWENQATFNTAALYDGDKVHFLYRAMGDKNVSVLGYAASSDGEHIDERSDEPAYLPSEPFEYSGELPSNLNVLYTSGGGYGGCEDPRLTQIDDTIYLTYIAYNGSDPPRLALSSIKAKDFKKKNWNWKKPVLISRPGVVNKNVCILPEKVRGKFVVFHRVYPNILVDYVDSLDFDGDTYLKGEYMIRPRRDQWDSRKVGAGPPPMKTKDGWLLIYHAVDNRDAGRYKIGAMLLDLNDPTRVLARTNHPIITPTEWYENEGFKAGVAYPCGAVIKQNTLFIYYGGADSVVCVAQANLDKFLTDLKQQKTPRLSNVIKSQPSYIMHHA